MQRRAVAAGRKGQGAEKRWAATWIWRAGNEMHIGYASGAFNFKMNHWLSCLPVSNPHRCPCGRSGLPADSSCSIDLEIAPGPSFLEEVVDPFAHIRPVMGVSWWSSVSFAVSDIVPRHVRQMKGISPGTDVLCGIFSDHLTKEEMI